MPLGFRPAANSRQVTMMIMIIIIIMMMVSIQHSVREFYLTLDVPGCEHEAIECSERNMSLRLQSKFMYRSGGDLSTYLCYLVYLLYIGVLLK